MTGRQWLLKWCYPLLMKWGRKKAVLFKNKDILLPGQSFYRLNATLNNGQELSFEALRNKKVLIVNTASDCGYTAQYESLQQLYDQYSTTLIVIAFPANDFGAQEKGSDEAIASFCQLNYGVTFPVATKSIVIKRSGQNPVFQWLTDKHRNGWNDQPPKWNFCKYLINEQGILTHYFDSAVSPLSKEVLTAVNK